MDEMASTIRETIAMEVTEDKQKRALLLHYGGPEVDEIFDTLQDVGEDKDYKRLKLKVVEKLTARFSPQVNATYEVYNFRQVKQKDGETLDSFHPCLRSLEKTPGGRGWDSYMKQTGMLVVSLRGVNFGFGLA